MTLQNAIDFLIQYLRDAGFEGDIENGTALYDLLIKPLAVLYTIFKTEADKTQGYMSLAKAAEYKSLLGSEYDTAIDSILSNWFVTRGIGDATTGTVRVFFNTLPTSVYIDGSAKFIINGVNFIPAEHKLYVNDGDFSTVVNTVRNAVEYYIDIPVISVEKTSINITSASTVIGTVNNLFYLRTEVVSGFVPGSDPETSDEFIARTQEVITTRELVSEKAIKTVLNNTLPGITRIYVAGYGAEEQLRDLVLVNNVLLHTGNKIDVYIQSNLTKRTLKIQGDTVTSIDYAHIISVIDDTTNEDITDYQLTDTTITVVGYENVTVTYLYSNYLALARELINKSVACCDIKLFYMIVLPVDITITVRKRNTELSSDIVKTHIVNYINSLVDPYEYSMVSMVNYIKTNYPNIYDIALPITVTVYGTPFTTDLVSNLTQLYTDNSYITVTIE